MCIRDRLYTIDKAVVLAAARARHGAEPVDVMPVSYTHLDVYKRQVFILFKGDKPMSNQNIGTVTQIIGPVLDIKFPDGHLPGLDVYKRQALCSRSLSAC